MKPSSLSILSLFTLCTFPLSIRGADLHVPTDYPTLQAAVDAANGGDIIHLAAGVYTEKTRILEKNDLTIVGRPGTILRAFSNIPADAPEHNFNWRSLIYINQAHNITIKNLNFQGDQLLEEQENGMVGVYYLDGSGTVENCRFTGFRGKEPDDRTCWAIRFLNNLNRSPFGTARIVGNTIEDCYGGIQLLGAPDQLKLEFHVENNVIRGVGPTEAKAVLRGISVEQRATGAILRNTISGFAYTGEFGAFPFSNGLPFSYGVLAFGKGWPEFLAPLDPIHFEGNTFQNNNIHLGVVNGSKDTAILENAFQGTAPKNRPAGLWITGRNVPVRGNHFEDLETGIRLGGEDPDFGTVLSFASNIQLEGNRFAAVAETIQRLPQATARETGTLLAPFPEPILKIEPALHLSWPSYHKHWSLQASSDLETWTPLELPLTAGDQHSTHVVPYTSAYRYFRLVEAAP